MFDTLPVTDAAMARIYPLQNIQAQQFARIVRELFTQGKQVGTLTGTQVKARPEGVTGQALAQWGKGMVKFLLHFLFLVAAVAYLARRGERFFWITLAVFSGGILVNVAYGILQLGVAQTTGANLDAACRNGVTFLAPVFVTTALRPQTVPARRATTQGTSGAFVAAVTAGHLLNLTAEQMQHAIGIAGSSAYQTEREGKLAPGESMTVAGRTLTYTRLEHERSGVANETRAVLTLSGRVHGTLASGINHYFTGDSSREVGIHTDWRMRFQHEVVNLMLQCSLHRMVRSLDELREALADWLNRAG